MAGGYSTGAGQSPRRVQITHPVRRSVVARSRDVSRAGTDCRMMVIPGLSNTRAAAAVRRNRLHFLVDIDAVRAASSAMMSTASVVGDGNIGTPRTRELKHSRTQLQGLVSASLLNGRKARSHHSANPAPYMVNPVRVKVSSRRGGWELQSRRPSEVVRRNAFQRLAGGSSVLFSSFRMTDSGGQKVRPDLHVVASSLAVAVTGSVDPRVQT